MNDVDIIVSRAAHEVETLHRLLRNAGVRDEQADAMVPRMANRAAARCAAEVLGPRLWRIVAPVVLADVRREHARLIAAGCEPDQIRPELLRLAEQRAAHCLREVFG